MQKKKRPNKQTHMDITYLRLNTEANTYEFLIGVWKVRVWFQLNMRAARRMSVGECWENTSVKI